MRRDVFTHHEFKVIARLDKNVTSIKLAVAVAFIELYRSCILIVRRTRDYDGYA